MLQPRTGCPGPGDLLAIVFIRQRDAEIGAESNIGAGTITANYDGVRKNPTTVGAGVFIGSDTVLVAPVTLGDGARTGAGAVVTKDVPDNAVAGGVPVRVLRMRKAPRSLRWE